MGKGSPRAASEEPGVGPEEKGVLGEIDKVLSAGQEPLANSSLDDEEEHGCLNGEPPLPYGPYDRDATEHQ